MGLLSGMMFVWSRERILVTTIEIEDLGFIIYVFEGMDVCSTGLWKKCYCCFMFYRPNKQQQKVVIYYSNKTLLDWPPNSKIKLQTRSLLLFRQVSY